MAPTTPRPGSSSSGASRRSAIEAELTAVADAIDRYRDRIAGLANMTAADGAGRGVEGADDLVAAMHEVERSLRSAHRHLARAIKLTR